MTQIPRVELDGTVTFREKTVEEMAHEVAMDAQVAAEQADYEANHKYKDDRRGAYGDIGAELDMIYWDQVNGTTTFKDHVAAVKADNPKPEE
jgi:hypothetical protein